ncbi:uncharacterized protein LOC126265330 [Aethina tumida]|uniref:uncharacterized protein LOC126265330 n=1 Tax=Aethina tumida TaxID=116153 RepID=UPI0021478AC1|nr:uncharacterized protein LOC126265330 [Aethina tumida]
MKCICFLISVFCLYGYVKSASLEPVNKILAQEFESNVNNYKFSYYTDDGQRREESAVLHKSGPDVENLEVQGVFSYNLDDGRVNIVTYTSGVNGFRPKIDINGRHTGSINFGVPRTTERQPGQITSAVFAQPSFGFGQSAKSGMIESDLPSISSEEPIISEISTALYKTLGK